MKTIVQSVLYAWKLLQQDVYHMVYMAFPYLKCSLTQAGMLVMSSFLNKGNVGDFLSFLCGGWGRGEEGSRSLYMQERGKETSFLTSSGSLISLKSVAIRNIIKKKERLLS